MKYADLDKAARAGFTAEMESLGFKHFRGFQFARTRSSGVHDILGSQILRSGERVRIWPFVWVREFDVLHPSKKYPPNVMHTAFPGWQFDEWSDTWEMGSFAQTDASLKRLLGQIQASVIPWFNSIRDGQAIVNALDPVVAKQPYMVALIPKLLMAYPSAS
jgi:hypothetical protein